MIRPIVFLVFITSKACGAEEVCGQGVHSDKKCVPWYLCHSAMLSIEDTFLVDERFESGPSTSKSCRAMEICCRKKNYQQDVLFNVDCAKSSFYSGLIRGGSTFEAGKFPFLVALVLNPNADFFCGGSLITGKHVLTAAHCVYEKRSVKKRDPEEVLVLLGRHNLALRAEPKAKTREVEKIIIHEDWKSYGTRYDADVAILLMDVAVKFSNAIRPICILNSESSLSLNNGTVAGWGQGDSGIGHETIPRKASVHPIAADRCFELQSDLGPMYSTRMFCAKGNSASPCHGDSGGSFFVEYDGHWIAKGIVSVGDCNTEKYMLYTKISDFLDWINAKVLESY